MLTPFLLILLALSQTPVPSAPAAPPAPAPPPSSTPAPTPAADAPASSENSTFNLLIAAPGSKTIKDLVYAKVGDIELHLDLFLPEVALSKDGATKEELAAIKPVPLVIWIHGGGWSAGNKDRAPTAGLTRRGFAGASIQYQLSGAAPHPAQIHDCKAAVRYLRANARKFNIDPDRIGVWGASAGGHLAALLATSDGDQALEGTVGTHLGVSSRVQSCCNFFGPTDLADLTPKHGSPGIARLMGGTPAEMPAAYAAANPITYIDKTDVPFLIMHGDKDNIVPLRQSEMLETALKAADVPVTLFVVKGAGHGFAGLAEAKMVVEFFERTLAMSNGNAPKESAQPAGDRAPNPSKAVPTEKTPVPNGK